MSHPRVFQVAQHLRANDGEPIRSVVHETADAAIVAWTAYFSDRGRLEQADRGRRNGVAAEALG